MTVESAQSDVADLKAALIGYISEISHTDATTQVVLQKRATLTLENWENAANAEANVTASAASSYGSSVGNSITKKTAEECRAHAGAHMDSFRRACLLGGVTIPTFEDEGVALWNFA